MKDIFFLIWGGAVMFSLNMFIFTIYFALYLSFELIFNAIARVAGWYDMIEDGTSKWSMKAIVSAYVGLMGGLAGVSLFNLQMFVTHWYFVPIYMIVGGCIITIYELVFGYLFNIKLKFNLWNYGNEPYNYKGLISLWRSSGWVGMSFFIYLINFWITSLLN